MIECVRQLVASTLTTEAVNSQLAIQNSRFTISVPYLDEALGVQPLYTKMPRDLPRPGIGYMVAALRDGTVELKTQGKSRMEIPLTVEYVSQSADEEIAHQQAGVTEAAVRYVLEALEGQTLAVTPPCGIVLVSAATIVMGVIDAAASGTLIGFRARYTVTVDDQRS